MSAIQSNRPEKNAKKPCNFDQKIPMKILSHHPLVKFHDPLAFCKTFSHQKEAQQNAQQKKKMGKEKQKKRGGEKAKGKR